MVARVDWNLIRASRCVELARPAGHSDRTSSSTNSGFELVEKVSELDYCCREALACRSSSYRGGDRLGGTSERTNSVDSGLRSRKGAYKCGYRTGGRGRGVPTKTDRFSAKRTT